MGIHQILRCSSCRRGNICPAAFEGARLHNLLRLTASCGMPSADSTWWQEIPEIKEWGEKATAGDLGKTTPPLLQVQPCKLRMAPHLGRTVETTGAETSPVRSEALTASHRWTKAQPQELARLRWSSALERARGLRVHMTTTKRPSKSQPWRALRMGGPSSQRRQPDPETDFKGSTRSLLCNRCQFLGQLGLRLEEGLLHGTQLLDGVAKAVKTGIMPFLMFAPSEKSHCPPCVKG